LQSKLSETDKKVKESEKIVEHLKKLEKSYISNLQSKDKKIVDLEELSKGLYGDLNTIVAEKSGATSKDSKDLSRRSTFTRQNDLISKYLESEQSRSKDSSGNKFKSAY